MLFDIGHADVLELIKKDKDRQFLLGQRFPDGPRGVKHGTVAPCTESTNPWPTGNGSV